MSNPLITHAKLPGRMFQLPSKGLFYEKGVLAPHVTNAEIQVHPMSALAEMKLRTPDLLFSGRAIREVCAECVPDILLPERLVSKDIDALFCFLRIATYGSVMNVTAVHTCPGAEPHSYAVNLDEIIMQPNNAVLDHRDISYRLILLTDQTVNLRPVTFLDSLDVMHLRQELDQQTEQTGSVNGDLMAGVLVRDVQSLIASVETPSPDSPDKSLVITDVNFIRDWLRQLSKKSIDAIVDQSVKANYWGFNFNISLTCRDCNKSFSYDLELDPISFFSE